MYRVRHVTLGTVHALKLLEVTHPELEERVLREGQLQAQLKHPNIVAVTDLVELEDGPALVLDYVDGGSLDRLLAAGPLPFDQAEPLALDLIEGVAAAHRAGVVHRDLKPANVLLATSHAGWRR